MKWSQLRCLLGYFQSLCEGECLELIFVSDGVQLIHTAAERAFALSNLQNVITIQAYFVHACLEFGQLPCSCPVTPLKVMELPFAADRWEDVAQIPFSTFEHVRKPKGVVASWNAITRTAAFDKSRRQQYQLDRIPMICVNTLVDALVRRSRHFDLDMQLNLNVIEEWCGWSDFRWESSEISERFVRNVMSQIDENKMNLKDDTWIQRLVLCVDMLSGTLADCEELGNQIRADYRHIWDALYM